MQIIPNSICQGVGETPLLDRIAPYIAQAARWFAENIAPIDISEPDQNSTFKIQNSTLAPTDIAGVIHTYALWLAAPMLDCTLHPNGLAVVSTDSLAPASPERSRAFREAIMRFLIEQLDTLIPRLMKSDAWHRSAPARRIWMATTFNLPTEICRTALLPIEWDSIHKAVTRIQLAETYDATRHWSHEMLRELRQHVSVTPIPGGEANPGSTDTSMSGPAILDALKSEIRHTVTQSCLLEYDPDHNDPMTRATRLRAMRQARDRYINICRDNPDHTRAWHQSQTARLYHKTVFRNERRSPGYFF